MAKLLIFTADDGFADALGRSLRREGHFCKVVEDEVAALQELRARGLSLVLLDDAPALPSVKDLREWTPLPILLLVDPSRLAQLPAPLEADDILVKPVREEEILFRVRNLCDQRPASAAGADAGGTVRAQGLALDEERYEIRLDGNLIDLTYREFELLKHLMNNPGRVFDREQLLNLVWGVDYIGGPRTVDVHIRRIRAKIEVGGRTFITTIRGVGYKFTGDGG
ncbi:MAG: response regulator transcription factor [Candidatus Tectomicrobia bacterium]|uniref:Phosphate regulon transcriptional regulatory protein PhoB n=1 Tax=Tectimicrobiota bacterium TaxID=2528274 RepID=A0A932I195_UNCTE|nr:response regulator transcription factor [Candidatus Tectomicrobia bacterium]